jgi:hypothetical protein
VAPALIQTLLKSLGVNPDELMAHANALIALAQSIDARLSLIAKQNELILTMLTTRPGAPPHPSDAARQIANGTGEPLDITRNNFPEKLGD